MYVSEFCSNSWLGQKRSPTDLHLCASPRLQTGERVLTLYWESWESWELAELPSVHAEPGGLSCSASNSTKTHGTDKPLFFCVTKRSIKYLLTFTHFLQKGFLVTDDLRHCFLRWLPWTLWWAWYTHVTSGVNTSPT